MSKEINKQEETTVDVTCDSGTDIETELTKLQNELDEQKRKTDEYYEYLQRNMAEFDNYKKRIIKEKDNLYSGIASDVVEKILPIMDNFEKAIKSECQDGGYKDGTIMIYNQLKDMLTSLGVTEVGKVGDEFDPNLHEAVMHIEDENFGEKVIAEVFRTGYIMKGKIIRHAMVKVAN